MVRGQHHIHMTLEQPQKEHTTYSDLNDFFSYSFYDRNLQQQCSESSLLYTENVNV